jgi:hypothetical protein
MLVDADNLEFVKISLIVFMVALLLMFVAINFGFDRDGWVSLVYNKISIRRYLKKHHEDVLHYDGRQNPLLVTATPIELASLLTKTLGVPLTPADFKYIMLTQNGATLELTFKFARRCTVFYGVGCVVVIQKTYVRTDTIITNTILSGL